jgi:outer membrane protein assembly factor BamA
MIRACRARTAAVAVCGALALAPILAAQPAHGQTVPPASRPGAEAASQAAPPEAESELIDVFDLIRRLRHKELTAEQRAASVDPLKRMYAIAPVIGYKPSSGVMIGAAGNVAFFRGDPATTHISSTVASLTYSSLKQTSLTARFSVFAKDDRWEADGDNRAQWTSQDTFGLGTATKPSDEVNMTFNYFRLYDTANVQVRRQLFVGVGFHYSAHVNVEPGENAEDAWSESPFVTYSEANGLPLDSQTSAGASLNVRVDTRDSAINPGRGWLGSVGYRPFFKGFLGGDSTWQELYLDARTYRALDASGRHKLAFWLWGDFVAAGIAPFLDLPATGMDKYGRSGRGYAEGRFRGERLLYGEVEYRTTLTANGLLGMVAFLNTTTLKNSQTGERLFDGFATGAGAGLRLLLNKRSKTNLCFDFAVGKDGSKGLYLAVQEAF